MRRLRWLVSFRRYDAKLTSRVNSTHALPFTCLLFSLGQPTGRVWLKFRRYLILIPLAPNQHDRHFQPLTALKMDPSSVEQPLRKSAWR